jgi:hypothetical protein
MSSVANDVPAEGDTPASDGNAALPGHAASSAKMMPARPDTQNQEDGSDEKKQQRYAL